MATIDIFGGAGNTAQPPIDASKLPPPQPVQQSPNIQQAAPADDNERAARVEGWKGFLQRLKSDPDMQKTLLKVGTTLMQPRPVGQTTVGQLGQAVQAGSDTLYGSRAARAESERANRELDIKDKTATAAQKSSQKQPAAKVQLYNLLADARIATGQAKDKPTALLDVEKSERTKTPEELFSTVLPLIALIPDPTERSAMVTRALEAVKQFGGGGAGGVDGAAKPKRQVWNDETGQFEER